MTNDAHAATNGTSTTTPATVSAAALVGGIDPRRPVPTPGPAWQAPLSMSWHPGPEDADRAKEELSITWGPTSQTLTVGTESFVHEGPPTTFISSGVARLLLAAAAPNTAWRPVGDGDSVRLAELNTALVEMLLDMVLVSATEGMPPDMIAPQIASASEWLVSAPSMVPFPSSARDAVLKLLTDIDDATLTRLSPIFFERRKVDRTQAHSSAVVAFRFRTDQVFEVEPNQLQGELARQVVALRTMASTPKSVAELTTDELVLRVFAQPDEAVATAAREEMVSRLRRMEAMGGQSTATMMEQLGQMMGIVANLYYLVKPACRVCALPATHMLQVGEQRDYRCDGHPFAPPASNAARDLPGAAVIRAGAFVARQSAQMAPPPAPMAQGTMR